MITLFTNKKSGNIYDLLNGSKAIELLSDIIIRYNRPKHISRSSSYH